MSTRSNAVKICEQQRTSSPTPRLITQGLLGCTSQGVSQQIINNTNCTADGQRLHECGLALPCRHGVEQQVDLEDYVHTDYAVAACQCERAVGGWSKFRVLPLRLPARMATSSNVIAPPLDQVAMLRHAPDRHGSRHCPLGIVTIHRLAHQPGLRKLLNPWEFSGLR